jgi:hypothetical protein
MLFTLYQLVFWNLYLDFGPFNSGMYSFMYTQHANIDTYIYMIIILGHIYRFSKILNSELSLYHYYCYWYYPHHQYYHLDMYIYSYKHIFTRSYLSFFQDFEFETGRPRLEGFHHIFLLRYCKYVYVDICIYIYICMFVYVYM